MNLLKKLGSNSHIILFIILLLVFLKTLSLNSENADLYKLLNEKEEILNYNNNARLLEAKILGESLQFLLNRAKLILSKGASLTSKNKLIILTDNKECNPCYTKIARLFSKFDSLVDVYLLVPSRNVEYALRIRDLVDYNINMIVDTSFSFFIKHPELEKEGAILL